MMLELLCVVVFGLIPCALLLGAGVCHARGTSLEFILQRVGHFLSNVVVVPVLLLIILPFFTLYALGFLLGGGGRRGLRDQVAGWKICEAVDPWS